MKKRILSVLLTSALVLSMTACGGSTPSEAQPQTSDTNGGTSAVTSESTTSGAVTEDSTPEATTSATTAATTTTAPAKPEIPVELPVITAEPTMVYNSNYIMNGCMAFKCDGKNYVYNITDNEMYETEHDVSEIEVLKGNIAVFGNVYDNFTYYYDYIPYVVNLKTGEQYADVRPFLNYDWNGSYLTVGKLEEGFSGNTMSIGVLNDKGEWVLPLSADYAVCKEKDIDKTRNVFQNSEIISFKGDSEYHYDIAKNTLIEDIDSIYDVTDDKIFIGIFGDYQEVYEYNISTGEKTYIDKAIDLINPYHSCDLHIAQDKARIRDKNYNLLEHDLSEYNIREFDDIKGATEDVIVFHTDGASGGIYTVIMNKNGDFICEPFIYDKGKAGGYHAYFSENKVIIRYNKISNGRIIDINTGEITEYDDSYDIVDYDTENNLMLVKTNGAYYLADPEAPDTLINPFERASN